jgi:hypothetical protein
MVKRIAKLPAPSRLQQKPNHNKSNDLPWEFRARSFANAAAVRVR